MDVLTAAIMLFLIMDPLGNIPVFLSVLGNVPEVRRGHVLRRELVIAFLVLLLFLFVGPYILKFLNLSQEAIRIGGGLVLFLIALRMIFPSGENVMGKTPEGEPLVVPLAIPMIAGPSSLAMLMLLRNNMEAKWIDLFLAVTLAWLATASILLLSNHLFRLLGTRGLIAIERLMGMVLIIISVQMLLDGIARYLQLQS
ncbi:MAG: MarC family protein [Arenicellales bacterium]|nr:hypothetical protein [Acidiferrobacteraceae bacterium]MDP6123463.1 MarC family protein [Arenicellales bacterium]MBT59845.1 hypothetical protein [Acidiferrobacteraceae bacterium]MDP6289499.1 MarC family protein [Arenicellales bacterium]MDP6434942.1 MarC family protein [Arenicellales bacterium]